MHILDQGDSKNVPRTHGAPTYHPSLRLEKVAVALVPLGSIPAESSPP
jgi:hypothetical protein